MFDPIKFQVPRRITNHRLCRQLDSVQTWKAFASAYALEHHASLKRRYQVIETPNIRLGNYIKPISSPSLDWITFLNLSNITCSRIDLIQISQLANIGALTIGPDVQAEEIGLDDSIIRSWARIAATSKAFSMLRVLGFRSQKDITYRIFSHLAQFPALAIFNVEDCNLGSQNMSNAVCHGWKYRTGKELSDCLVKGGTTEAAWDSVTHASFQLGAQYNVEALTAEGVEAIDGLPRLQLSLGGLPRPAAVDASGNGSLRSFYRSMLATPRENATTASSPKKRPWSQSQASAGNKAIKTPALRVSKQQNMEDLLMGFSR